MENLKNIGFFVLDFFKYDYLFELICLFRLEFLLGLGRCHFLVVLGDLVFLRIVLLLCSFRFLLYGPGRHGRIVLCLLGFLLWDFFLSFGCNMGDFIIEFGWNFICFYFLEFGYSIIRISLLCRKNFFGYDNSLCNGLLRME